MRLWIAFALMMLQGVGGGAGIGGKGGMGGGVSAPTGITYVGECDNGGSPFTTISCTYASVPAGATLAIGVSGAQAATSVSDSVNGAATQVGTNLTWNSSFGANMWVVKNATAGSHTITATYPTSINSARFIVNVLAGANAATPVDTSATGVGTVSNTAITGNFTTATANEMVIGFVFGAGGPLPSSTVAPYTLVIGTSTTSMASLHGVQATAGTYNATVNLSASGQWAIMAMALKQ